LGGFEELVSDETSRESVELNFALALEAYVGWLERLQIDRLADAFLEQCLRHVPYYTSHASVSSLDAFPIVGREEHLQYSDAFQSRGFSDTRLRRLSDHTNGTLGPSIRVYLDLPSFFDSNYASFIRFVQIKAGLRRLLIAHEPCIFVVSDSPRDGHASIIMPGLGETRAKRLALDRDRWTDVAIVEYLRAANVVLLHGKPSVLKKLAQLDRSMPGPSIRPGLLVCSGENLYQDDRLRLEESFECSAIDAYAASEAGLVGFECLARRGIHILTDHLTVEILDEQGGVSDVGSGELLLTNLINWRHAFVRYRIGDHATVTRELCACGHDGLTISELPGRDRRVYWQGCNRFESVALWAALQQCQPLIAQFQVRARPGSLVIAWIPADPQTASRSADRIKRAVSRQLPRLNFDLAQVETITPPGGKLRRFV